MLAAGVIRTVYICLSRAVLSKSLLLVKRLYVCTYVLLDPSLACRPLQHPLSRPVGDSQPSLSNKHLNADKRHTISRQ